MEKSKVYFTDFRVQVGVSLLQKLKTLCLVAGIRATWRSCVPSMRRWLPIW